MPLEDALGGWEGEEVLRVVAGRGSGSVLTPRKAQKWVGVGREAGQRPAGERRCG